MFFFLSKFFLFLIQPLNWILGLTIYGLVGNHPRRKRRALRIAIGLLFVISNPIISNFVAKIYEAKAVDVTALPEIYDYGLVLGGFANLESPYDDDRLNLGLAPNRLTQTVDLYHQNKIRKILLSGGNGNFIGNKENESLISAAFLKRIGIPAEDVLIETESRNTFENFKYSKKLIAEEGKSAKILLITSAFHIPRSKLIAKKTDLNCDFFPTDFFYKDWEFTPSRTVIPNVNCIKMWEVMIKEWFGLVAYKLKGYV